MKHFFLKTYFFWIISRFIFIFVGVIDACRLLSKALDGGKILIDIATLCYFALMIYNTVLEFGNKTSSRFSKYVAGILSILIAVSVFVVVLIVEPISILLVAIFAAWLTLLGIFDLVVMNRQEEELDSN